MDENEHVCPLCCEELDLSDRQFYPCKCGYQVCMWCWHRIRESESGLCPACRTPYGDDPHEFSAVDVEEVLKANKEKAAAEKRERSKLQHHQNQLQDQELNSDGESPEPPKDRTQLANMRVIRRNLVYAVGLPSSIATEETLRKPEYFGQYGKIAKIVLNRAHVTNGDPRRASASAYVTFVHKEDTLACVLSLDGFFLDGRNVRASYGTSKYCSAFIKNVRCNNPECTYLHHMGAAEDTFTKQEIQAGYVTSGRDVLARQQQIVAQALSAATSSSGGTRHKVGGGGPSGTGRASANPVFPVPSFDEALKPSSSLMPPPAPLSRSVTTGPAIPAAQPLNGGAKVGRSVSMSEAAPSGAAKLRRATVGAGPTVSAASVVAGVHTVAAPTEAPAPHTTLTSLTPLKRTAQKGKSVAIGSTLSNDSIDSNRLGSPKAEKASFKNQQDMKLHGLRNGKIGGTAATSPSSSISSLNNEMGVGSLGGTIIGAPVVSNGGAGAIGSSVGVRSAFGSGSGSLGGQPIGSIDSAVRTKSLGGDVCSGPIGGQKDKWSAAGSGGLGAGLWDSQGAAPIGPTRSIGGSLGVIGGGPSNGLGLIGGDNSGITLGSHNSESSALASMLGISLPSGSGSLQESSPLFGSSQQPQQTYGGRSTAGVIGARSGQAPIGGNVIGGGMPSAPQPPMGGSGNRNDMALLQSLLPGVHITSGNAQQPAAPVTSGGGGWNRTTSDSGLDASWGGGGSMLGQNGHEQLKHGQSSSSIW